MTRTRTSRRRSPSERRPAARAAALAACLLLHGCAFFAIGQDRVDEPRTAEQEFPEPPQPYDRHYVAEGRRIHYVEMPGGPERIVFIHGTPGDWVGWRDYLLDARLRARATLIAVDRPGFGGSSPGAVVPSLVEQARLLQPLLHGEGASRALVVGHSLGGPIAAELALDYPESVLGAVLVAPAIAPEYEHPAWYNYLVAWLPLDWALRELWVSSNEEIMPLQSELRRQAPRWKELHVPVTVLQGDRDDIVDPRTADFAERVMPKPEGTVIRLPGEDHFVLWTKPGLVTDAVLATLDRAHAGVAAAGHS